MQPGPAYNFNLYRYDSQYVQLLRQIIFHIHLNYLLVQTMGPALNFRTGPQIFPVRLWFGAMKNLLSSKTIQL